MKLAAALVYWPIVAGWMIVGILALRHRARYAGENRAMTLLLLVILIDAIRNVFENTFFGLVWGARFHVFPPAIDEFLSAPQLTIIPKLFTLLTVALVLVLLMQRYVPRALQDERKAEADLQETELRFRTLVDGVKEYAIYSLDREGRITSWNAGAERIKGYSSEEAIGMNVSEFYTAEDRREGVPAYALKQAELDGCFEMRGERLRKDGSSFWANIVINPIYDASGEIVGFAKVTKDITQSHAAEKMLEYQARHDRLTGLWNRATLFEDMRTNLSEGRSFGLAIVDLDGFKEINDTHGHLAGDRLLQQVAKRFRLYAGAGNSVYRLGGDEFVVLAPNETGTLNLVAKIEHLLKMLEVGFVIDGGLHHISGSCGIVFPSDETDPEAMLANADLALYEAKASGGRNCTIFVPAMRARLQARRSLETQLRQGHERGEFELYYQPQVSLANGRLVGAEALIRWNHPEHGVVRPAAFIDALASSPFVIERGRRILDEACRTLAAWRAKGLRVERVGINLFPAHFRDSGLEQDIERALSENGLAGEMLEIEITENIALQEDASIVAALHRLRERGVHLAFDDFGTGYASLSCLTRYPLTRIKIDRSFISPIATDREATEAAIVRPMITMAHYLGLQVIAEGIETPGQVDFLRSLGCEEGQGFLYGKPLPAAEFEKLFMRPRNAAPIGGTGRLKAVR